MGTASPSARWGRIAVLLLGLIVPQAILYGPSLTGAKVLLPLDLLAAEGRYFPAAQRDSVGSNFVLLDEVLLGVPQMEYTARELRGGHIPLWNPQNFAGAPFATFPKYSPAFLIFCLWPHPVTLAYIQLIKSVIAGLGAYLFLRRALGVGFWAAAVGAWCYPLTGFFVHWQGFGLTQVVAWFPWILWAVNLTVRRAGGIGAVLLAILTGLAALAGQLDVAGLVLLSSGLYAVACLVGTYGREMRSRKAIASAAKLALGWGLGLGIAMMYVWPLVEYSQTGERFVRREAGEVERPPEGLAGLPQIVLPNLYGSTEKGSLRIVRGNQPESAAAGYAGLLAALLLGPLAFCHRELKKQSFLWLGLMVLSVGWAAKLPGLIQVMHMPGANVFSWNRWTMLTGFAATVLAVIGLDALMKGMVERRAWFAIPALLAAVICGWCLYREGNMPPELLNLMTRANQSPAGRLVWGLPIRQAAETVGSYFHFWYGVGAGLGALTLMGWAALSWGVRIRGWMVTLVAGLMLTELLVYGYGVNPQSGHELYYPRLAALEELKQRPRGRTLCLTCLPPELNLITGLADIRGYDAVDPKRLIDLLELAQAKGTRSPRYARTQWFLPRYSWASDGELRLSPLLDMLNVRYLIRPELVPSDVTTIIRKDGYEVVENGRALPRTFVPQAIQPVRDEDEVMGRVGEETFDAGRVSYVTEPVDLPGECSGQTRIEEESPEKVMIEAQMDTAGMVVLADLWDKGWRATLDGQGARILMVNHAIRGVIAPAGKHQIVFRYEPDSVKIGRIVSGLSLALTLGWLTWILMWQKERVTVQEPST